MKPSFQPPQRGGIAGLALLFCAAAGGAGLAFDFLLNGGVAPRMLVSAPGGRALIGLGVALVLVLAAHVLRRLLGRALYRVEKRDA